MRLAALASRQHRAHLAFDDLARQRRQACCGLLSNLDACTLRLRHRDLEPDAVQPVDSRQGRSGCQCHALAHLELLQHPGQRCDHADGRVDLAATLEPADRRRRHPGQAQALAGGVQQRSVAGTAQRQVFLLRGGPLGDQQIRQWRTLFDQVARCMAVDALDEAAGARLHQRHVAGVVFEHAHCIDAACERTTPDRGQAHAEILGDAGVDADGRRVTVLVGVARHQIHVHEGDLPGLSKRC